MDSAPTPSDAYYAMKNGDIRGPFSKEELARELTVGNLTEADFVQLDGYPIWQPLRVVLQPEGETLHGALAPAWRDLGIWSWRRVRYHMDADSDRAGIFFLGLGSVALILTLAPFFFWLPCFIAAGAAAVTLLRRHRTLSGALVLAGAVLIPVLFLALLSLVNHWQLARRNAALEAAPPMVSRSAPALPPPLATPLPAPTGP